MIMDYVYGVINGYDLRAVYVTYRFLSSSYGVLGLLHWLSVWLYLKEVRDSQVRLGIQDTLWM